MNKYITILAIIMPIIMYGCQTEKRQPATAKTILAENDSVQILSEVVDSAKDEYDIPEVAIWIRNKTTSQETKLYKTVRPVTQFWYMGDGDKFSPVSIDSIPITSRVYIYNDRPLQLIVEGCPDMRNEFSYFIDVPSMKAWYVPANCGYVCNARLENCMIFESYRYVSDLDVAGRYTFFQVFDESGNMVDSLNLEHLHL